MEQLPARLISGTVAVSDDDLVPTEFLLDDAADVNIVSQTFVVEHGLARIPHASLPRIDSFQGHRGHCYGAHLLTLRLTDSANVTKETRGIFYSMDMPGPPVILGRPWRRQQAVIVHSQDDRWRYGSALQGVTVVEPEDFYKMMKEEPTKYSVYAAVATNASRADSALPPEVEDFADLFTDEKDVMKLGTVEAEHQINLQEGKRPPFRPLYNLSGSELALLQEYLDQAMANGWIQRSTSEAGAPILFVPKKDGTLRLCVDYRGLNDLTIKDRCPLPLIDETLARLGKARWFSKLDLKDAYHRIPIRRTDRWKTAFRTRYGHFEYLVMPFGLTNAPATFQAYINKALAGMVDVSCVIYLDDILVYSDTREEHVRHLRAVLTALRKFALYASRKKCEFFADRLEFLRYIITADGVSMDRSKVSAIADWPAPKNLKEVQAFLGFANFYRRFVEHYSKRAAPLTSLSKGMKNGKGGSFRWGGEQAEAFRALKEAFTTAPILRHYDPALPIKVETDASVFAMGGILSQLFPAPDTSRWHPVAYYSRKFIPAEVNYETHDQELLAIVDCFKQWRHYLEGAPSTIRVLSDHNNLQGFMGVKTLNGRQARWAIYLSRFDFTIEHNKGVNNPADGPSRRADYADGADAASRLLPTLQNKLAFWSSPETDSGNFAARRVSATCARASRTLPSVPAPSPGTDRVQSLPAFVCASYTEDERPLDETTPHLASLISTLQDRHEGTRPEGVEKPEESPFFYKGEALWIPEDETMRSQLLRMHHDDPLAGHFGRDRTLALLSRKYWWPELTKDVEKYCQTCPCLPTDEIEAACGLR